MIYIEPEDTFLSVLPLHHAWVSAPGGARSTAARRRLLRRTALHHEEHERGSPDNDPLCAASLRPCITRYGQTSARTAWKRWSRRPLPPMHPARSVSTQKEAFPRFETGARLTCRRWCRGRSRHTEGTARFDFWLGYGLPARPRSVTHKATATAGRHTNAALESSMRGRGTGTSGFKGEKYQLDTG